jgi:hypothetical protein
VNVVVLGVALIAFEYFLSGVIQLRSHLRWDGPGQSPLSEPTWWVLGYLLFMLVNLFIAPLTIVTPDLCVEAVMLFASGIVVHARAYGALGVILGAGYLIKSPMFPVALVYLGVVWLARRSDRRVHKVVAMR